MMTLLFARPYEWLCTIAVLLFTILIVLRLDEVRKRTIEYGGLIFIM